MRGRGSLKIWMRRVLVHCARGFEWLLGWLTQPIRRPRLLRYRQASPPYRIFAQPKPKWVKNEVIRLKAVMPRAGCRTIAHTFNRRWRSKRQLTVSKTYVADLCRKQQYLIYEARRKRKHRIPD